MMEKNLTTCCKFGVVNAPIAAANNTNANSSVLDMQGFECVTFIVPIEDSAATGVATVKVQQGDAANLSDAADITGASASVTCAVNDDINGQLLIVEVYRPLKRYVRLNIGSATANIAFGTATAIQCCARTLPTTQPATVAKAVLVVGS